MSASENVRLSDASNTKTAEAAEPRQPLDSTNVAPADKAVTSDSAPATAKPPQGNRPPKKRPQQAPGVPAETGHIMDTPLSPPLSASVLKEMRQKRARKLLTRVLAMVVLPTLIASVYFGLIASDEFESTSLVVIERRDRSSVAGLGDEPTNGIAIAEHPSTAKRTAKSAPVGGSRDDALLVKEFILSRNMLAKLEQEVGLLKHYQDPKIDTISRLSAKSSREKAYGYYLKHSAVQFDSASGLLTVHLRAYDSAVAAKASDVLLRQSEQMLNALGNRAEQDSLKAAEAELERARMESSQKTAEATLSPSLQPAPTRATLTLTNPDKVPGAGWSPVVERAALAQQRLAQAEQRVALLTDEVKRKDRYVVRVAGPSEPDEATYPRRSRAVLTTFLFSIVAMGILSLLFSAVRDHTNL